MPFRRSAQEIARSIAEGSGEQKSQFINNLKQSKAALRVVLFLPPCQKAISAEWNIKEESRMRLIELSKMLSGFITSLWTGKGSFTHNEF